MMIPRTVQALLLDALTEIRQQHIHDLSREWRSILYQAFSPTLDLSGGMVTQLAHMPSFIPSPAYYAYSQLAIATAQHVLPQWNRAIVNVLARDESFPANLPQQMLAMARGVLERDISVDRARNEYTGTFYTDIGLIDEDVPFAAAEAATAAYTALGMVLGHNPMQYNNDVVLHAANAYSALDPVQASTIAREHRCSIHYDTQQRLAFWEWWLTTALPQSWLVLT